MSAPKSALAVKALFEPMLLFRALLRKIPLGSFEFRLALDALPRPWYAYGVYMGAQLARRLGVSRITVVEFGVAGGTGLAELERMARAVSQLHGIEIRVVGFDSGVGMPEHLDYRDLPYFWQKGHYRMDEDAVRRRLTSARLVLGEVAETVPAFLSSLTDAPIAFIAFDLDYYSSTRSALKIFDGPDASCLPRVLCYFDDIVGTDEQLHCEDVGELLAIREFNHCPARNHRIRPIHGLNAKRPLHSGWSANMFAYQRYDHQRYEEYLGPAGQFQP